MIRTLHTSMSQKNGEFLGRDVQLVMLVIRQLSYLSERTA